MSRAQARYKRRFEVLRRSGFACVYCGRRPPEVVLEIEHVIPLAEGGTWDLDNLRAACRECNLGKGRTTVDPLAVCLHRPPYRLSGGELVCGTCDTLIAAIPTRTSSAPASGELPV